MSANVCLRCLARPHINQSALRRSHTGQITGNALNFSTTSVAAAKPTKIIPKKKAVNPTRGKGGSSGSFLRRGQKQSGSSQGRKDPAALKALRKRIVLSNANALEVQGLQELSPTNALGQDRLSAMLTLDDDSIDALRALEAFKHNQGWNLFRKPSTLVTLHTSELARVVEDISADRSTRSEIITGDRGSGKSVLALQAMTFAFKKGWVVINIAEGQDLTQGHTSYSPLRRPDGSIQYTQADYTASLLNSVAKANAAELSKLTLAKQHNLPIPIQSNITLHRLAELGALDPSMAYAIFTALMSELLTPSSSAHPRPPLLFSMDAVAHAMLPTAYLSPDLKKIHAHDLSLISTFTSLLSGRIPLPNGGLVLAVDSASNRPASPALDFAIQSGLERQRAAAAAAAAQDTTATSSTSSAAPSPHSAQPPAQSEPDAAPTAVPTAQASLETEAGSDAVLPTTTTSSPAPTPAKPDPLHNPGQPTAPATLRKTFLSPHIPYDARVTSVLNGAYVRHVGGLSKREARGVMEYYARSGVMRGVVDERRVGVEWSLAGGGVVGELEGAVARLRI